MPDSDFINLDMNAYSDDSDDIGKKVNSIPVPEKNIDIDTSGSFIDNVVNAGISSVLDIGKIESFTQVSNNRETIMQLLDTMAEDTRLSAALEIYAEDTTESNDAGDIVWCVSDDDKIAKYVTFLLNTMNVNRNIYKWAYSLCKYGDVYLRLYRESEYEQDKIFNDKLKKPLNEDVILKLYKKSDPYSHYVEMVPNPAEMFELTRYGKTCGYIKANVNSYSRNKDNILTSTYRYAFKKNDVEVYDATSFVHAALEDNSSRTPEEVDLFLDNKDYETDTNGIKYTVRRGQSLLYNLFKIWRMMMLLENSMLLNRVTKSSVIRIVKVQVGDMPKENVGPHLMGVKQLFEQKTAFDMGNSMSEYTNPGPVENNVYIPVHGDQGAISIDTVNSDVNVNGLGDIDYFTTKLYSGLRIPKQYLGDTDDPGGFNGGTSLSLQSSRYAKAIKRIQATLCQMITDAVNLMLLDKGLDSYVNHFTIMMQSPTTQEERDRQESKGSRINLVQDIMNLIDGIDIEDASAKLRILKYLLSDSLTNPEVITILQEQIEQMEAAESVGIDTTDDEMDMGDDTSFDMNFGSGGSGFTDFGANDFSDTIEDVGSEEVTTGDESLPSPNELNAGDFTDLNNEMI